MKHTIKITISLIGIVVTLFAASVMLETKSLKNNKIKVRQLIEIGQNLYDAQDILKKKGYKLVYEKPIDPTLKGEYLHQLVIVGDTKPKIDETLFYTLTGGKSPLRTESPYLAIESNTDGIITLIQ